MLAISILGVALRASGEGPEIGKPAPALDLKKLLQAPSGTSANWTALRGQVVVLGFWATSCGPWLETIPHWNELAAAFEHKPVRFIAITHEDEETVATFLKEVPIHTWVGLSPCQQDRFGVRLIPTVILVNQSGIAVGLIHPAALEPSHIYEVLKTGKSSLPPPVKLFAPQTGQGERP